ncbi:hypothetical protein FAEPRAM212_01259 [Faecalibacterium prausnitzii M21/2]|uniref:Uncharacterized protein n=1 Tax=Faecalibacterium prausnitzii M21/2 TaxID=411485 RepID=A8SA65_9FIRM|nr:hypothetical protein FAEPRAM212_01259 [Faecalibacterium prausnitzii M21/2]
MTKGEYRQSCRVPRPVAQTRSNLSLHWTITPCSRYTES